MQNTKRFYQLEHGDVFLSPEAYQGYEYQFIQWLNKRCEALVWDVDQAKFYLIRLNADHQVTIY